MSGKKTKSVDLNYLHDDKVAKGKEQTVDKSSGWKGPSHKERQEQLRESKRVVQQKLAREKDKVSWRKRAAMFAALFIICGVGVCQFVSTVLAFLQGTGISTVGAGDTAVLKEMLFSGEPWLVYCVNNETVNQRLPKVLEDSARSVQRSLGLRSAVLPCWDPTESGRSVAQKFKLPKAPPLAFVVANGNKPRILNLVGISNREALEKRVKPALEIETYRIDALKKWPSLCTSRRTCIVVGHRNTAQRDAALRVLRPLLEGHRAVKVVVLDTSFWQLKLEGPVLATRAGRGRDKGADVLCLAREEASSEGGNVTHSGVFLQDIGAAAAAAFLKACEAREGLVRLEKTPRISARPTKPKKVVAPTPRAPRPQPAPSASRDAGRGNVDRVGSRERMESEEPLFEAVEEDEEGEGGAGGEGGGGDEAEEDEEDEEGGDEVEL